LSLGILRALEPYGSWVSWWGSPSSGAWPRVACAARRGGSPRDGRCIPSGTLGSTISGREGTFAPETFAIVCPGFDLPVAPTPPSPTESGTSGAAGAALPDARPHAPGLMIGVGCLLPRWSAIRRVSARVAPRRTYTRRRRPAPGARAAPARRRAPRRPGPPRARQTADDAACVAPPPPAESPPLKEQRERVRHRADEQREGVQDHPGVLRRERVKWVGHDFFFTPPWGALTLVQAVPELPRTRSACGR
jgi:hypothetical protein